MTAQATEVLRYKDQEYEMQTEPLALYVKQNPKIQFASPLSSCWRGYIGTWEIIGSNDKGFGLYLVELKGYTRTTKELSIKDVFPDYPHGVFAHWFNGTLKCPFGEQLKYVHMGYNTTYEKELLLEIKQGLLINESIVNNKDLQESL